MANRVQSWFTVFVYINPDVHTIFEILIRFHNPSPCNGNPLILEYIDFWSRGSATLHFRSKLDTSSRSDVIIRRTRFCNQQPKIQSETDKTQSHEIGKTRRDSKPCSSRTMGSCPPDHLQNRHEFEHAQPQGSNESRHGQTLRPSGNSARTEQQRLQQPQSNTRTYHSTERDTTVPFPFHYPPNLFVTGRHSEAKNSDNELVFHQVFQSGQSSTREVLQSCRSLVADQVRSHLGVAIPATDDVGDSITIVTKRAADSSNSWKLSGDVRIRFPSVTTAKAVYHQQRATTRARNAGGHLVTFDGYKCTVTIPSGTNLIDPDTKDLHRAYVSCGNFRGLDNLQPQALMLRRVVVPSSTS